MKEFKFNQYICHLLTHLLLIISIQFKRTSGDLCKKIDSCQCETSSHTINLNPLGSINGAEPLLKDGTGPDGNLYSYKPCLDFTETGACTDVAACVNENGTYYSLGNQNSASFGGDPSDGSLFIAYTDGTRTANVSVVCSAMNYNIISSGNSGSDINTHRFILETKYACLGSPGLSAGSVLLIIFFVLVLVYFIVGFLYMRFISGAQGVEQIPNYEFWKEFPLLVKDGVVFTMSGCKTDTTYDEI